jgi:hypothetical protein
VRVYSAVGTGLLLDIISRARLYMAKHLVTGLTQQKNSVNSGPVRVRLEMERVVETSTTATYSLSYPKLILTEGKRSEV